MAVDTVGELWHKMLCHMSQKGMQMLSEKELLSEVKKVHLDKCLDYLAGKPNRVAFRPRPLMRKKSTLELVHMDVCQDDANLSHSFDCHRSLFEL